MRLATIMWGGQMCPLIPVAKKMPPEWSDTAVSASQISRGYVRFFEPDLLVQTAPGQLSAIGVNEEPKWSAHNRYFNSAELVRKDIGRAADLNVGVNIIYVYQKLFTDEFQFQKRLEPKIYHFSQGTADDTAFFEAAYGLFPADDRLSYVRAGYVDALGAKEKAPTFETWLDLAEEETGYPLYYTIRDSDVVYADRSDPAVFIFDPAKGTDLIDFWNFRLFTRHVLPVNVNWLEKSRDVIIREIKRNHRPLPRNPNGVMIGTEIHVARSLNLEEIVKRLDLTAAKLPERSVSVQGWYEAIWQEPDAEERVFRPSASVMTVKSRRVQLTPTDGEQILVRFPMQAPDFDVFRRGEGPCFVNVIKLRQYNPKKNIANALPAATFASRDIYPVRSRDQFVTREGYVTLHGFVHDDAHLWLASPQGAIVTWLASKGVTGSPSDAGRVAEQVIESVGGLVGTAILRERSILEQLHNMARSRTEWKDGSADEYSDKAAPVQAWFRILNPLKNKIFGKWKTLNSLVERGILQLGLSPRCPNCTQENWYSLDAVGNEISCARCLKRFPFPQGSPTRDLFKYRVVGPFATPGYARGGYSVALTLRFLEHELDSIGEFTFSTGLELKHNNGNCETDFLAWHSKDRFGRAARDPITLVGECKSLGVESFGTKDLTRLRELGSLLPGSYLVAATLKDEFSIAEIKGLRALARWGWRQIQPNPLIVLTGVELFGEETLSHVWAQSGGSRAETMKDYHHIFDFITLASATQQAILGMTFEEVADVRYKRSRTIAVKRRRLERAI